MPQSPFASCLRMVDGHHRVGRHLTSQSRRRYCTRDGHGASGPPRQFDSVYSGTACKLEVVASCTMTLPPMPSTCWRRDMLKMFACIPVAVLLAHTQVAYGQANRPKPNAQADCRVQEHSQSQASVSCSIKRQEEPSSLDRKTSREVPPAPPVERRLGQYSSWDGRCRSSGAPRVRVVTAPRFGVLEIRREADVVSQVKFGTDCSGTVQSGSALYYKPTPSTDRRAGSDFIEVEVHYWDHPSPHRFRYRYSINLN